MKRIVSPVRYPYTARRATGSGGRRPAASAEGVAGNERDKTEIEQTDFTSSILTRSLILAFSWRRRQNPSPLLLPN
jgi:hypothetical protein